MSNTIHLKYYVSFLSQMTYNNYKLDNEIILLQRYSKLISWLVLFVVFYLNK